MGPFDKAQSATITSQFRIQSILSPTEPEADDLSGVSSNQSTPKRRFEEAFSPSEATSVASHRPESLDGRRPKSEVGVADIAQGHVDEFRIPVPPGNPESKKSSKMRPPMRSSIACLRCRRSKIKCDNDGGNSPCETCIKAGHKCQYPEATLVPKRSEPPTTKQERDTTHERKRAKKTEDVPGMTSEKSAAYAEEVLSYPFLTNDVWDQVLTIYRLHFATELPFLHLPTLKEKMSRRQGKEAEHSSELNLVLLGVLTLTARFHPDLVKYISHMSTSQGSNVRSRTSQARFDPCAASEFFANALTTALGPLKTAMTIVTVERVQAFLMLGLFEWSQRYPESGSTAWMYVGVANRLAQILRLGLDDKISKNRSLEGRGLLDRMNNTRRSSEIGIIRETRRRTMFSCMMLDHLMASGIERVPTVRPENLRIQLPCTEMAFDLALEVHTGFLKPLGNEIMQPINDDSVLRRFVQLIDLWGYISNYSSTGGRLQEVFAPWDERSTFGRLRMALRQFLHDLPETFTLSRSNYYRHDNHQATNMYVSLHMLSCLCQIILDREHLPFLPLRCSGPQGPLDSRSSSISSIPDGFWEECAESVFSAARDIVDMVEMCRDKLPHSSLTLFAMWTAGFFGVYAQHFPLMDTKHSVISQEDIERRADGDLDIVKSSATGLIYQSLHKMAPYLQGTDNYLKQFHGMNQYFAQAKGEFQHYWNIKYPDSDGPGVRRLSIRLGEPRGRLDDDKTEGDRTDTDPATGSENDRRPHHMEALDRSQAITIERGALLSASEGYPPGNDNIRGPSSTPSLSFRAINNAASLPPILLEPAPPTQELHAKDLQSTGRPGSRQSKSQLDLPGSCSDDPSLGIPVFSMERLSFLESQRIGKVLNDLQDFSGIGTLGGVSWNDLDGEESPYPDL